MSNPKIDQIIQQIEHLPTLPVVSQQIQELVKNKDVTIKDLENLIEKDAPLATKILRIVNSSFYGLLNKTSSLEHALVILGISEVKNIVLGFSVQNYFSKPTKNIDRNRFWKHSIVCSQIAKFLGNHYNVPGKDSLFLSGLIHDMGKLVFDQYFHEAFEQIIERIHQDQILSTKAEKEILGVTHYQVGAKMLQQWQFPKEVTMQVFYHHAPWYDKNYSTGSIIIYLADIITKITGYTCLKNEKKTEIDDLLNPAITEFLAKNGFDLNKQSFEMLLARIHEHLSSEAENTLNLFD